MAKKELTAKEFLESRFRIATFEIKDKDGYTEGTQTTVAVRDYDALKAIEMAKQEQKNEEKRF